MSPAESQGSEVIKEIRRLDQAIAVDLSGDIDLHQSPALRETLAKLIDEDPGRLVLENGAVFSGTAFGAFGEGYVRFSYANSQENIRKALKAIESWVGNL